MSKNQSNNPNQKSGNESVQTNKTNTGTKTDQAKTTPKTPVSDDWKKRETDPNNPSAGKNNPSTGQGKTGGTTSNSSSRTGLTTPTSESTGMNDESSYEETPDREVEQDEE